MKGLLLLVVFCSGLLSFARASDCNHAQDCSTCSQTPNCIWCGKSGEFDPSEQSLVRCVDEQSHNCGSGDVDDSCRADNRSRICSGHGSCNCGECVCNERDHEEEVISGKYCDCTNFMCDRYNGEMCSGPSHGQCVCDKCDCRPGWTGDGCQCSTSTESCVNPDSGIECSGNGKCECNQCKCHETEGGRYSGKWCEDCPTCVGKCQRYKACVQCQVFGTGAFDENECASNCTLFNSIQVNVATAERNERLCTFFDVDDCRFTFVYGYDENREPIVRVQQMLECPPTLDNRGSKFGSASAGFNLDGGNIRFVVILSVIVSLCKLMPTVFVELC